MPRTKSTGANAVRDAAMGHNSRGKDEQTKKYVTFVAERESKIKSLRNEIKEEMVSAREDGCPVKAIRRTAKYLAMSEDKRVIVDEEQVETDRITELCRDLPLFAQAA